MENIAGTSLVKSKSSKSTIIKSSKPRGGMMSSINIGLKESKKRGVYVEKWGSPKQFQEEEIKRQPEESLQPKPRTKTRSSKSPASTSKVSTSTRPAIAPNPRQPRLHKPANKTPAPTTKFPKKISTISNNLPPKNTPKTTNNLSPKKQPKQDGKLERNIIKENKNQERKFKFKSNALRQTKAKDSEKVFTIQPRKDIIQTPSNTSKLTRDLSISDHVHWSKIFPSDPQKSTGKNRLQDYIDSFESAMDRNAIKENNMDFIATEIDATTSESNEKDKQIYNFFRDLLETVYDENLDDNPNNKTVAIQSGESSKIKFEIEENVAQKLNTQNLDDQKCTDNLYPIRYNIKADSFDQRQQLADYYRSRTPLIAQMTYSSSQRKTRINKRSTIPEVAYPKADDVKWKKPKKQSLLSLLKEQLSTKCNSYEEPENMYQALRALASRKRRRRQICFDISVKDPINDSEKDCRFKRREVISPSTGLPRKKMDDPTSSNYKYITTRKYLSDSSETDKESNHSLEVLGYEYDDFTQVAVDDSDNDSLIKSANNFI